MKLIAFLRLIMSCWLAMTAAIHRQELDSAAAEAAPLQLEENLENDTHAAPTLACLAFPQEAQVQSLVQHDLPASSCQTLPSAAAAQYDMDDDMDDYMDDDLLQAQVQNSSQHQQQQPASA